MSTGTYLPQAPPLGGIRPHRARSFWIAIALGVVLGLTTIGAAGFATSQTTRLHNSQDQVASLQADVTDLNGTIAQDKTRLENSQTELSMVQDDLARTQDTFEQADRAAEAGYKLMNAMSNGHLYPGWQADLKAVIQYGTHPPESI